MGFDPSPSRSRSAPRLPWSFYLFGVAAGGRWFNVALIGPLALTGLFQGSTNITEQLSAGKYPAYAAYKKRTSQLIPWWPSAG